MWEAVVMLTDSVFPLFCVNQTSFGRHLPKRSWTCCAKFSRHSHLHSLCIQRGGGNGGEKGVVGC